jgi:predicted Zn-dependent protease
MRVLGRSPVPLGTLLTRLTASAGGDKSQPSLLDSHPATPERLAAMKASGIVTGARLSSRMRNSRR